MRALLSFCCLLLSLSASAQFGPPPTELQEQVREAMDSDIRTGEERARDANRQPADVLEFFGLQQDMVVLELLPFSGWYTKILAPVLYDEGKLYVSQPDLAFYSQALVPTLEMEGMDRVEQIDWNPMDSEGLFIGTEGWDVEPLDMVLTFRNYHNFAEADRKAINVAAYEALKPGGVYGVVDHTRRHMEPDNPENGRRMDPVLVIKEVQEAGFILDDYSGALRRPDDELRYEVGRPSVTGNTDRFTLRFRKPEE